MVDFRAPKPGDAEFLAANLRPADRAEAEASAIHDIPAAIAEGMRLSYLCWVAEIDGVPAAAFGVRTRGGTGTPWMLGTDAVALAPRAVIEWAPRYIAQMLAVYPTLCNRVHADNVVAVRWLRRAGFKLAPVHLHEVTGAPFHWFTMTR